MLMSSDTAARSLYGDTRAAGRCDADRVHVTSEKELIFLFNVQIRVSTLYSLCVF